MRRRGGQVCAALAPATFPHTAESWVGNSLPTEPAKNSDPPWYHSDSQVHKTFFFFLFFSPSEFTVFKKPFPVSPDQKEAAWGVFQFQIVCDSPIGSVGFIRKLGGRERLFHVARGRVPAVSQPCPSRGARGRQAGRQGGFFCGWFCFS